MKSEIISPIVIELRPGTRRLVARNDCHVEEELEIGLLFNQKRKGRNTDET